MGALVLLARPARKMSPIGMIPIGDISDSQPRITVRAPFFEPLLGASATA
jgi:hypothetical protein